MRGGEQDVRDEVLRLCSVTGGYDIPSDICSAFASRPSFFMIFLTVHSPRPVSEAMRRYPYLPRLLSKEATEL